jgi:hypothetical protein
MPRWILGRVFCPVPVRPVRPARCYREAERHGQNI